MYEKIKAKYYEMYPDEKRLEFGCKVKSYCHPDIDTVVDDENEVDSLVSGKYAIHERDNIEILGKDIDIREVLRMHKKKCFELSTQASVNNEVYWNGESWKIIAICNLGVPIKDQKPEVLESIYKLIK